MVDNARAWLPYHRAVSFRVLRFVAAARATPAGQADAYALLLDHLGIGRAVVLGFSAGSGSVLEFGLRHPDRVIGLILANCRLGGGVTMSKVLAPALRLAYSADRLFWIFKKLMPTAFSQMMEVPKGYRPTPEEAQVMAGLRELQFPLRPRGQMRLHRRLRLQSGCRPVPIGAAGGPHAGPQRPG